MFMVTSTYTGAPEAIAAALPAHREWVAALYDEGIFILSGRIVPPTGGFMLAVGVTREALETILAGDPFREARLLDHAIIELAPTRWAPALETVREAF